MKRKLISLLVLFMVAMATVTTQAQTRDSVAFQPHWFVQPQVGVGYHVGEAKFSKLLSPTAALSVGRQFSPVFGLRLGASGWQARNWQTHPVAEYKWNYVQANLDATVSLTNLIWGWNADRKWNVYGLAGVGLNIAFKNDDANKLAAQNESAGIPALANGGFEKLWDGTKLFPAGRLGAGIEYALSERVALGLEYNAEPAGGREDLAGQDPQAHHHRGTCAARCGARACSRAETRAYSGEAEARGRDQAGGGKSPRHG